MNKRTFRTTVAAVAGALVLGGAGIAAAATASATPSPVAPTTSTAAAPAATDAQLDAAIQAALAAEPGTVVDADRDSNGTFEIDIRRAGGGEVEVTLDSALKVIATDVDNDRDDPNSNSAPAATDAQLDAAIQAALAAEPGTVVDADRDSNGAYEIDIRRAGGGEVEVTLDSALKVIATDVDNGLDD